MVDVMVLRAQQFINLVYGDRIGMRVDETGRTGWQTMYALTRALQWELGIAPLSNSFGPTTLSTLTARFPLLNADTVPNDDFCRIIQAAMYCKGYDGGEINGVWNSRVEDGLISLKTNMGVQVNPAPNGNLTPKMVKALLTMDAYVTVAGGTSTIRTAQQWLNGRYLNRRDFFIIPCDGRNSRDVAKSMLFAIQYELGMADGVANGVFGPGTRAGLRSHTVSTGSSGVWVSLFTAAMNLNLRSVPFAGSFTAALATEVRNFQAFVELPQTGQGDYQTWASLLVSYGDQERRGAACDGVTRITPARAATLRTEGISYVGRYLTSLNPATLPEKMIQAGELQTIADNGLRCFPIYQTFGRDAAGYTYAAGRAAGLAASIAATDHGFRNGTRIFFAVDFDAMDDEITNHVLPHFKGIEDAMRDDGNPFRVGVYGPRNVCTRVAEAGHSTASFVSDMSSGFSGNYGFPLPADWAYDQIVTRTIGSGAGQIEIDVNIASGRDTGQNVFNPPRWIVPDREMPESLREAFALDVGRYMESLGIPNDGGTRTFGHATAMETMYTYDSIMTGLSNRHDMRKALVQTSIYWEMRHIGVQDEAADLLVIEYHDGDPFPSPSRDSSTGIGQVFGVTAINAWNHCIARGYESGPTLDPDDDGDLYATWTALRSDGAFSVQTVFAVHLWGADGKGGGDSDMREMALDYNDREIFEILRRYQGSGEAAEEGARKRLGLYYVFEKYNAIARNL